MALSDEFTSCSTPSGYPSGTKTSARPRVFCESVTIQKTLTVEQPVDIGAPVTVTGAITCDGLIVDGISLTPVEIVGLNGAFTALGVQTGPPPEPEP